MSSDRKPAPPKIGQPVKGPNHGIKCELGVWVTSSGSGKSS